MRQLAEIVFEDVQVKFIEPIVSSLVKITKEEHLLIQSFLEKQEDGNITITPRLIMICNKAITDLSIRVLKYSGKYDIELLWDIDQVKNASKILKGLHQNSISIASKFNVTNYYGGLEPACDRETRFFSNTEIGPITFD